MIYRNAMEPLSDRKQALLKGIIDEYVEAAKPVSSKLLVDKLGFDLSSATVRNEMKELEDQGYITHPHTSAGRVPTEVAYRYYVANFLDTASMLDDAEQARLSEARNQQSDDTSETIIKRLAKQMAELSQNAVLLTFDPHSFYYTGISHLFRKPEFLATAETIVLSELIDHLDEVMTKLHQREIHAIDVFLGTENPVSEHCATLVRRYAITNEVEGVMAILGPMRMDYRYNYTLLKYIPEVLDFSHIR